MRRKLTRSSAKLFHHHAVGLVTHAQPAIFLVGSNTKQPVD